MNQNSQHFARRCTLVALLILAPSGIVCNRALAYVPFYGGATYSEATGGYRDTGGVTGGFPFGVEQDATVGTGSRMVSAVNDAGVAVSLAVLNYSAADGYESEGRRAMRLTPSGVVEMDNLERGAPDFNGAAALDINANGVAVGQAYTYVASNPSFPLNHDNLVDSRPVRWNAASTVATELDSFNFNIDHSGHAFGAAYGVNAAGTAVGFSVEAAGSWSAARWDAGGTAIRHLNGGTFATAYAINDAGLAVGYSSILIQGNPGGNRAVRWDPANVDANNNIEPSYLSPVEVDENGVGEGYAWDINNAGTAIGVSRAHLGLRAVRWDANSTDPTVLDILAPYRSDGFSANNFAYKINAGGTVVGIAEKYNVAGNSLGVRPARWAAGGHVVTELGLLGTDAGGNATGVANDINDSGVAVGEVMDYNSVGSPQVAVYWGPNGAAVDLNRLIDPSLGWHLVEARHISNTGWITGHGYFDSGTGSYDRAFLIHLPPTGDYNLNGIVDAADYTVWRDTLGSSTNLAADGNQNGMIDSDDYTVWKNNFGTVSPGFGSGAAVSAIVPEPASRDLLAIAFAIPCAMFLSRRMRF